MKAWLDGRYVEWEEVKAPLLSHGFSRGSAIYEVLDIVMTDRGPAYFGLDAHIDRFFKSAALLHMDLPKDPDEIKEACLDCARENSIEKGGCKFYAYFTTMEFGEIPLSREISIAIFCWDFNQMGLKESEMRKPVSVGVSRYLKLHPETTPVHAKVVGNYVNGYLALEEVRARGYDEALLLDCAGRVAEAPTASVCFVKKGKLLVPPFDNVLKGITRLAVEKMVACMGLELEIRHIYPEELECMDEAFYAVSLKKIVPVKAIDGKALECPGPVTRDIINRMDHVYAGRDPEFAGWLELI